ncbi:MAG: rRNA maturation RNase YbeY [Sphingomonadales bacterium]
MTKIDLSIPCSTWLTILPDVEGVVRSAGRAALAGAGWPEEKGLPDEIGITLADDDLLRRLNRDHRGQDRPTNVLSFPVLSAADLGRMKKRGGRMKKRGGRLKERGPDLGSQGPVLLGDVVVALATAQREARARPAPLADHVSHLVVHGVLHLLGYDHIDEDEAIGMETLETRILAGLGMPDPYQTTVEVAGAGR